MPHNEDTRVKIPALVHFTRLGYQYISLKKGEHIIDEDTNIFVDVLCSAINRINNTELTVADTTKIVNELKIQLAGDDLGKAFYNILLKGHNGLKLIDFDTANGVENTYQIVTEFTCKNGSDEFRPDITVLINGLTLGFIEVKKPNNKDGIQAEYHRMRIRVKNKKFRRFINMMQLMVFSNNSEYDDTEVIPLEGAFYATTSYEKLFFSHFREEDESIFERIKTIDTEKEIEILKDNNYVSIKTTAEYKTNLSPTSPTNRILTSLFSKNRLMMILKYAIAYVERTNDNGVTSLEKHIMRYPQLFATKAIEKKLNSGVKNGIIWHTQGSGKTALAYYNVRYLKDYYQKQSIIAKFYFVVDRLDLATQAADEFRSRGLLVEEISSKEDFVKNMGTVTAGHNTGKDAITVVNIQKFSADSVAQKSDYNVNVQRVYFMDEAHRSYNPIGSFLSNLINSDRNAVMIALTGTPLIGTIYDKEGKPIGGKTYDSKAIFGNYIHKYYYNQSIADGYTLKLIREGISTTYRQKLQSALDEIETIKGSLPRKDLYAHPKYVKALVEYIVSDFEKSRLAMGDETIGGMIVCDSSEQAQEVYKEMQKTIFSSALILCDEDDQEIRKDKRNSFKKGGIDFLIVFNMLLTGFDAPRLKKLYLGRVIRNHSLLQALTRVNRPYKKHHHGYVVDFADIRAEFDKTNKAYFDELQNELGDAFKQYDSIFKTPEEIESDLKLIAEKLFSFDTQNAEIFSQQVSQIDDKAELLELRHALELYKELFNIAKLFGYNELADKFDLNKISSLYTEVVNRINIINTKKALENADDMTAILNLAMEEIDFNFKKVSEHELVIADSYRDILVRTQKEMQRSLDPKDPEYVTLLEELQRLLKKKNIEELTADEMKTQMQELERIRKAAEKRNQADARLAHKYEDDSKFMRTHKRIAEAPPPIASDLVLHDVLINLKHQIDDSLISNEHVIDNEAYFMQSLFPFIKQELTSKKIRPTVNQIKFVGQCIANEYITERNYAS
ncbi:type I restriction enzyme R subunit [Hydrogenoanaerobacterium saccharovorans]|uniref:type I site-specific deoxyribonuclease n=1 Tax=Hydrogenoanaerobacterium saccharovorans TaxID=474960 RepID=A0A1H7YLC7_9FIRM|nr:type I restriction enzyme R subunit [Hydrogenoanaerobacterium saccharovorans]SEM46097.1 type I restriction enzyme, R subunit [Hydrogenoanaerobacterium saccharovorans]